SKRHVLRAALQPLQSIRFDAVQRGELAQLTSAEAVDAGPVLRGDATMAAFYLNELCMRLAPRHDPQPDMHHAYAITRERLGNDEPLAWTLRRFERDLLQALGVGFALDVEGDGQPLDPAARYLLDPEHGPRRALNTRGVAGNAAATGCGLLALAADASPARDDLASLRLPLRGLLLHYLDGRGLKSWDMMGALGRLSSARPV
ncbi:MAG: DNA repair protein RecO C-terminal domain-containing protein, partial [Pseudomonadota bacterium]|nr:DNA repair protein RecO C-terminal domain-containing protein [Pseudomonadota bacterium]MDQ3160450.1 DNA repair protein RecO C-terminal domain-containing protein [Pseudomonadota bacterium]